MQRALALARSAQGRVEPNPCVGAVVVDEQLQLLGEGCHERFGGPHAEVMALRDAGKASRGATLFVTLEPCNHHGKTPPCSEAVISAGIKRIVIATRDPVRHVQQSGVDRLINAGIDVSTGLCEREALELIAPFCTLMQQHRPFVHAKWAMTLDGKIATRSGSSKWITNPASRAKVHLLRGRMDAVLTGIGTVLADNPLLTARPAGPRTPLRIVLDSHARLPLDSQLVQTAANDPVLVAVTSAAPRERVECIRDAGVEVLVCDDPHSKRVNLPLLLEELGRRRLTNLFIEAGAGVLGAFLDGDLMDEVHCFIAPKLVGGLDALSPIAGIGAEFMSEVPQLVATHTEQLEDDVYINGRVDRNSR